jgi:glycosyltransferase involved in cell wall biosynthesis
MKIIYIGPIGKKNKPHKGGFEAANRKNIDKLISKGIEVFELPYPDIKSGHLLYKIKYVCLVKIIFSLFLKKIKGVNYIIHFTPLYKQFIYFEIIIIVFSKILGFKILTDFRAGSFITYYKENSSIYRWFIRTCLNISHRISVEGYDYIDFIKQLGVKTQVFYLPNTVEIKKSNIVKLDNSPINLFYFGRISTSKGTDILIKLIDHFDKGVKLYLAGNIEEIYKDDIFKNKNIEYLGLLNRDELEDVLKIMHFFVFPTVHKGEGQSNSLIEAMNYGLIPICSSNGFNTEVVANCGKVLDNNASSKVYYSEILNIINSNMIEELSKKCKNHIYKFHNLEKEIDNLINNYKQIS